MKKCIKSLLKHKKVFFSKSGEDGLLSFILSKIPDINFWCVEVGAFDGKSESNTFYFISQLGYNGVMIEADPIKFKQLCKNLQEYNTLCFNNFVRPSGINKLDNILNNTSIPRDFDLLSIDIDGDDYYLWESLRSYQPKVVIIEINLRFKPGVKKVNQCESPIFLASMGASTSHVGGIPGYVGTSISSMDELAKSKHYRLLAVIDCNAIFVKKEYLNFFYDKEVTPKEVFTFEGHNISELTLKEMRSIGFKRILRKLF